MRLAAACTARTVDAIWRSAGDRSADFSWYTKRAILAAVYGATLLYWLRDSSEDDAATLGFLDRRLAGVGRIGSARRRVEAAVGRLRPVDGLSDPPPERTAAIRDLRRAHRRSNLHRCPYGMGIACFTQ
jgi:ubiquinone biosynthesis protein COQ9